MLGIEHLWKILIKFQCFQTSLKTQDIGWKRPFEFSSTLLGLTEDEILPSQIF